MTSPADGVKVLVAGDGVGLAYRHFPSRAPSPRGSVVYLHGIQSHGGWYVETAKELARRGYSVYLPDRRGSGLSAGVRGFFPSWDRLVDDVGLFVERSRRESPGPTFLVAGCWGARPGVAYALREQRRLAGLALVCPAIKVKVDLSPAEKLKVVTGRVVEPRWRVRVPLTPEMFTSNPEYLPFVRDDPLSLRHVTAGFFFNTFLSDRELARRRDLALPLLLLQSGSDPIVDTAAVRGWFDGLASPAKHSVLYPGFGHILDFEPERQTYWDDLVAWLDRTSAPAPEAERAAEPEPVP
jgi:acylglycerol lipase